MTTKINTGVGWGRNSRYLVWMAALGLLLTMAACSEDEDSSNIGNFSPGNGQTEQDVGTEDVEDEVDADDVEVDAPQPEDVGDDADPPPEDAGEEEDVEPVEPDPEPCEPIIELGTLTEDVQTVTFEFEDYEDWSTTTCENTLGGSEAVIEFRLADIGTAFAEPNTPVAMGVRQGDCADPEDEHFCSEGEFSEGLPQGLDFFMVVERLPDTEEGPVEIDFWLEGVEDCEEDIGESICIDDQVIEACNITGASPDVPRRYQADCPTSCSGDRCVGDTCENPLQVSASTHIEGSTLGLFDEHDSAEVDSCSEEEGGLETLGRDLMIELQDLTPDHQVDVDFSHNFGDPAVILVKEECGSSAACLETWKGEGEWTFEPPSEGNFFLIVDARWGWDVEGTFELSIDIEEP